MSSRISQELFDETVLENQQVFELSAEEALKETLSQYSQLDLSHLVLSHPSNDSNNERHERKLFLEALNKLNDCIQEDGSVIIADEKCTVQWLETVARLIKTNPKQFLVLLHQQEAMYTLLSLFTNYNDIPRDVLTTTIQTLVVILTPTRLDIQSQLRDFMGTIMPQWMKLFTTTTTSEHDKELQSLLLQMAYNSCYSNEDNKKQWMKAATMSNDSDDKNGIDVLLNILQQDNHHDSMVHACQLLTTTCRFDDFRTPINTNTPIVSSANDNVLEFARHQAVPILFSVARNHINDSRLLAATLSALRVLAIHDSVVQSMVAVGVLDFCATLLQQADNVDILSATLGLIRNLSANDQVKTTLCNDVVLSGMMHAMQTHLQHSSLQEHACASLAAMALRKPLNAQRIVQSHHGHVCIVTAMQQHSTQVLVQRQGALALRNLASRSNNELRQVLLDAGAEAVLRQAGQHHQTCVDEAYAALRDLGCNVKLIKLDKQGKAVERTVMFGDVKPNFRPVLEESSNDITKHTNS